MTPDDDLPELTGLDALDEERAADMIANRPRYGPPAPAAAPTADVPAAPTTHSPDSAEPPDSPRGDRP